MISQEMRRKFLKYFKDHHHTILPSSPVVPHDDPSLLFTNAGMNQFKDVFLGKSQRDYKRAATAQKCIRGGGKHNDLDNVGHTSRHLTFFEMLGNFSFGDYFKKEAIHFAWEVSTSIFEFDPDKIWPTIFETDDEAYEIWEKIVPAKRIIRMGEKENFWAMGDTGPCGPCSELLYDRGSHYGNALNPKEDASGERYLEFWNLVFMQFNRNADGKMESLPKKSIDTGAGLERLVSIKMGVESLFATDILRSLIAQVEAVSQKTYDPKNRHLAPAFHVIADHIRSLSFAIADGAQPSNVERGYVLRKLLRRAVRYGRMIGLQEPFLAKVLPKLVDVMGEDYPELRQSQGRIAEILTLEEEAFIRTLKRGGDILNSVIQKAQISPSKQITGDDAFKLKDTYGLPLEEIVLIAKDSELQVDLDSYAVLEEQAKEKSRASKQSHGATADSGFFEAFLKKQGPSHFAGYSEKMTESSIVAILKNGEWIDSIESGDEATIFLDKTPFYAEKGGQVGDTGTLFSKEALFAVSNCLSPFPNLIAHVGKMEKGSLKKNDDVKAEIDSKRRTLIQNNHTATHLLHWALQHILGSHIRQAGSVVDPSRLRFDFNHHKSLSQEELKSLEDIINEKIRENKPVKTYEISYEEAQKQGEIKQFFGDKYGAKVRVVDIDFSKELCGGTHVKHTGDIGYFRILKENSIAAGIRRIEAVTGREAELFARELENAGQQAAALIKSSLLQLPEKTAQLIEENKRLSADLKIARRSSLKELAIQLSKKAIPCGTAHFLGASVELDNEEIGFLTEELGHHLKSLVLVLATKGIDRCQLFVKVSPDLVQKGLQAVHLIKEIAPLVGGSGGGRADSAQAGGKQPEGIKAALDKAQQIVLKQC